MTLTSQWDGKCKGQKTAAGTVIHEWKVGQQIWYQKEPKCVCVNEDCYEEQKAAAGQPHPAQAIAGAKSVYATEPRTESERTEDAKHMIEILWGMAKAKALEVIPISGGGEEFWENRDRLIFAEVLYKSLTYSWTRP